MMIRNLLDVEFKTLVIRILKELTGYFNSIKKTQAEMKLTLSEIKKNVQGINSKVNEIKDQINDLEQKATNQNKKKKKDSKKLRTVKGDSGTTSSIPIFES